MVSPTPTTAHPPVLSYAESAKKAQGVRHPSQPTQKPLSNPPRQPPAPPPELKKPAKPSSSVAVDVAQMSLVDLSLSDASVPGAPGANVQSYTSTGESTTHDSGTREVALHRTPSAGSVPPHPPSHPPVKAAPAPAPVPNVWNQRIQQRAQARSQPRPSQPHLQTPSSHVPRATSPPRDSSIVSSSSRQPDPLGSVSVQSTRSPSSSSLNGASSSTPGSSTGTTPSSRKELPLSPQRSSLVSDVESWPEVGKSHIPTGKSQRVGNGHVAVAEEKDDEEKNVDAPSSSHPDTPRKSEKTKWIVIPPGELQAAADAINPSRPYSQSRSHSARDSQPRSAAVSASGSTHTSQTPSKVTSGRTSASHSRAHSPNSIASSPHHSGRSRQLPVDARGDQAPEQPPRSSEGNSPQAPVDVAAPVPYVQISRDVYGYGNLPTQTSSAQPFVPPPPPPPPPQSHYPPALRVNPNHTQQPYASSSVSPYPQPYVHHAPSDRYGPAPAQPLPPGWGPTDHFVYSYGYPPYAQAHPIMYWPGNLPLDLRQDGRTIYPTYPQAHPHQQVAPPGHVLQDDGDPPREGESTSQPTLPPPTMISRPPPPQESDAVAGYRAMGPLLDNTGSRLEEAPGGRRDVIFGSIGVPGRSEIPSPPPLLPSVSPLQLEGSSGSEKSDRVAMVFSIGVAPGEAGPSHVRSRTRSQPRLSQVENTTDGKGPEPHADTEVKVIDLTDPEIKWEFGTANRSQDEFTQGDESRPGLLESQSRPLAPAAPPKPTLDVSSLLFGGPLQGSSLPAVAAEPSLAELQPPYPHAHHPIPYVLPQQPIHVPPRSPVQEELQAQVGPGPYPVHHPPPPQSMPGTSTDGFEVKDFGYGFGRTGGTGHGVASPRDERFPREREWERSRETDREHYPWRPRRGSYSGHNERGGYAGRRARGGNGYGRGSGRGRWGTFRQQHQQHQRQQQQPQQQQQQQAPPFTVTPPAQAFQPLQPSTPPPRAPPDVAQYIGTTVQQQPYVPGFEAYQAPVPLSYGTQNAQNAGVPGGTQGHPLPRPLSNLTLPLDATRYYLLGQLEYYLSAQNLVSDYFLRKRMDSRGWIPISLLASFNRVRQLTLDPQLVREVLAVSQIVEMRDDCVRMGGGEWAQFVLADAPVSTVQSTNGEEGRGTVEEEGDHVEEEGEVEEEEEEEDIEIVMDREVIGQRWMGPSSS